MLVYALLSVAIFPGFEAIFLRVVRLLLIAFFFRSRPIDRYSNTKKHPRLRNSHPLRKQEKDVIHLFLFYSDLSKMLFFFIFSVVSDFL